MNSKSAKVCIGVLALQGDFYLHINTLSKLQCRTMEIRTPEELAHVNGLIIPGGESTTLERLIRRDGLGDLIRERHLSGTLPIFGTCMGMILLAKDIENSSQYRLGLMDITVNRNAYGRQVDSFEVDLYLNGGSEEFSGEASMQPFHGVFIRAPIVKRVGKSVRVLAEYKNRHVLMREGGLLAASFHPEITDDTRIHELFLKIVVASSQ
jgi:5'-phosphate synthase pdxT subunit